MDNKSCVDNKHQYGLWDIDKEIDCAFRVCDKCSFKRVLPITKEVKEEIERQDEALKIFKAFQLVSNEDENIVNYLDLILDDYVNYLSKENFKKLRKRVKVLEDLDIIDAKNVIYLLIYFSGLE